MIYRYAADAVLLLQLAFIVFAVLGGLLIVWWSAVLFFIFTPCIFLLINIPKFLSQHSQFQNSRRYKNQDFRGVIHNILLVEQEPPDKRELAQPWD